LYQAFPDLPSRNGSEAESGEAAPNSKLVELNRYLLDRAWPGAVYPADGKILP